VTSVQSVRRNTRTVSPYKLKLGGLASICGSCERASNKKVAQKGVYYRAIDTGPERFKTSMLTDTLHERNTKYLIDKNKYKSHSLTISPEA
jgi:hypothetical protein